jgi:hypothetical protein
MEQQILATACSQCGSTEWYCAEEVDQRIAELERKLAECRNNSNMQPHAERIRAAAAQLPLIQEE